jgi:hypothetical protein
MGAAILNPRFFTYRDHEVKEVSEAEYTNWVNENWHPSHLAHHAVENSRDEVWLGFQGHYKFCEWNGKPFNVTYFEYGSDYQWASVHDEYFSNYQDAFNRYYELIESGHPELSKEKMLSNAA